EGAPATLLLGYGLWQSRFGGAPDVVGRVVRLDDEPHTIIGVMPKDFAFPDTDARYWVPMRFPADIFEDRGNNYLQVLGRLGPGATLTQAQADLSRVAAEVDHAFPSENHSGATVTPLRDVV